MPDADCDEKKLKVDNRDVLEVIITGKMKLPPKCHPKTKKKLHLKDNEGSSKWNVLNKEFFDAIDTDGDGQLTPEEAKTAFKEMAYWMGKDFNQIHPDDITNEFNKYDVDNSGFLTEQEYIYWYKKIMILSINF